MSTNTPIATQTLTANASSVTFSSIPQGYTDLVVVSNIIPSTTLQVNISVGNNSLDTGTNYSCTRLYGNGSSVGSDRSSSTANSFGNWTIGGGTSTGAIFITQLQNYSNATTYKTFLTRVSDMTAGYVGSLVSLWRNTSAINILSITGSANFAIGSTFSIYGIQTGNKDQKATGGNIVTTDGTYMYHAFTSSGSFIPNEALTANVLVVAGGGGSGDTLGGGGGAGGLVYNTGITLNLGTTYAVTVGSGGATTGTALPGKSGTNSNITGTALSLTAAVGGGGGGAPYYSPGPDNALPGGSGGGGAGKSPGPSTVGTGTVGQGNNGGSGSESGGSWGTGGGGGAGAVGGNGIAGAGGVGGNGSSTYSSWGSATSSGQNVSGTYYYAGGGGGGWHIGGGNSVGGYGGGGAGGTSAVAGTANTGGGGGAPAYYTGGSRAGGSGIVIIRYLL